MNSLGDYQQGMPPNSKNFINCEESFARAGRDGDEHIFSLFGTKKFFGEVLLGTFHKFDDGVILGPFTALITGGDLEMTGGSAAPPDFDYGWLLSQNRLYMIPGTVIDIHMKLPAHATATRWFTLGFYLMQTYHINEPESCDNHMAVVLGTDDTNYKIYIHKEINGVHSDILVWTNVANQEGTFRIKIEDDGEYTFYYHVGAGAIDEATDEVVAKSDLGLLFNKGCVAYQLATNDAVVRTATSEQCVVTYPKFDSKYDLEEADVNKGACEIWDGDPDGAGIQVFDEDHEFANDCYIQNGLIRLHVDEAINYGMKFFWWDGAAFTYMGFIDAWLSADTVTLDYPFFKKILFYSEDKVIIRIHFDGSAVWNQDYYLDVTLILERGKYSFKIESFEPYPLQRFRFRARYTGVAPARWGYAGDNELSDDDLGLDGTNTTMSDNFLCAFDDDRQLNILMLGINQKPALGSVRFQARQGGLLSIQSIAPADIDTTIINVGLISFPLIANLFREAEYCFAQGWYGATPPDLFDPGVGESATVVRFNAQNENIFYQFIGVTDLPVGRYLAYFRSYGVGAVQNYRIRAWCTAAGGYYLNQEKAWVTKQAQNAAWNYDGIIFDITTEEDSDTIQLEAEQNNPGPNTVYIDYILLFPISNGESWPQDLAHSALRGRDQLKKVYVR